eukprot:CAMPEP_0203963200 /NCGR_PEP_ID=MMETSP0359-20131031/93221_1 /ASSEMBLY_ACC=CAM_ASM_000338 /TAXON_ID=268821 /ORGANISM="Scrippsiella Hangoei, Strain SHTV-5" /LENGTH=65 /DNA_ID=CAMNT_0050898933 /DNA_START=68 /DNA_END=265 /DNA_ORIENTATION=+
MEPPSVLVPPLRPCAPLRPKAVRAQPDTIVVNMAHAFQCKECSQSFDTEHALGLHVKYIHKSKEE